jgi:mono/diheme cytochrome c family protein
VAHRLVAALIAGLALAIGCNPMPGSSSQDGRTIYQELCARCHGPDGKPPEVMAERLGVRDLSAGEFRVRVEKLGPAMVAQQVRDGSKAKLMPSFAGVLDDAQITAVAEFVASPQFGRPAPAPGPPAAPR